MVPNDTSVAAADDNPIVKIGTDTEISQDGSTKIVSDLEIHPNHGGVGGSTGPAGPPGPQGSQGPAGPQGISVFIMHVCRAHICSQLVIVNSGAKLFYQLS